MPLIVQGLIIGFVVAVPFGPIGLLCINRALSGGPVYGLFSGLGVATADAIAAGIAAVGWTLISSFFVSEQLWLRLFGGLFLCYLGVRTFLAKPRNQVTSFNEENLTKAYATMLFFNLSHPGTILSFLAIYAGWGIEDLSGHYLSAAVLSVSVFCGSALWWFILCGLLITFQTKFTYNALRWVHIISGMIIAGFGFAVLLSLSRR
jgi:threonine/homoserine/homoserine lactone efflux protein